MYYKCPKPPRWDEISPGMFSIIQDGAFSRNRVELPKSDLTMVYGRYNELINHD